MIQHISKRASFHFEVTCKVDLLCVTMNTRSTYVMNGHGSFRPTGSSLPVTSFRICSFCVRD